jgi:hypothetical protein
MCNGLAMLRDYSVPQDVTMQELTPAALELTPAAFKKKGDYTDTQWTRE